MSFNQAREESYTLRPVYVVAPGPSLSHIYYRKDTSTPETELFIPLRFFEKPDRFKSQRYKSAQDVAISEFVEWLTIKAATFVAGGVAGAASSVVRSQVLKRTLPLLTGKLLAEAFESTKEAIAECELKLRDVTAKYLGHSPIAARNEHGELFSNNPAGFPIGMELSLNKAAFATPNEATVYVTVFQYFLGNKLNEFKLPIDFEFLARIKDPMDDSRSWLDSVLEEALAVHIHFGNDAPSNYTGVRAVYSKDPKVVTAQKARHQQWHIV